MEQRIFNPSKLTKARIARGLTKKDLAERTGISRQMISNYELGKTQPGANNLMTIVAELDFPYNYFTSESKSFYEGATFFRSQSASTKKIKDIEEKARELREIWGLGIDLPVSNLLEVAEINGVIIVEANMSDETLDAVSEWIGDRPFIMLTDNGESAVRRRFNIAHEIGHILLHGDIESIHDYTSQELKNVIEKQANYFASCLLLPENGFLKSLLSTNLDFYIELKKYWKVSIQAMIMRTHQLELISDDQKLYLFKKIAFNKWKRQEPLDTEIIPEKPSLYRKVYELIVTNDILQRNELISYLSLPKDELEKSLDISIDEQKPPKHGPILRIVK